jgi:hypothetical protein
LRPANELIYVGSSAVSSNSQCLLSDCWIRSSFQIVCLNGSLNGVFTVQGSNDLAQGLPPNQFTPTNWNTLGSVTCSISSGVSSWIPFNGPQGTINYFETCARYHRVIFVAGNSGNTVGSFSIRTESKGL